MTVNCVPVSSATVAMAGLTANDTSVADSTTREAEPLTDPCLAVMFAVPADCPVAVPNVLMVATLAAEELQVTALLMT